MKANELRVISKKRYRKKRRKEFRKAIRKINSELRVHNTFRYRNTYYLRAYFKNNSRMAFAVAGYYMARGFSINRDCFSLTDTCIDIEW